VTFRDFFQLFKNAIFCFRWKLLQKTSQFRRLGQNTENSDSPTANKNISWTVERKMYSCSRHSKVLSNIGVQSASSKCGTTPKSPIMDGPIFKPTHCFTHGSCSSGHKFGFQIPVKSAFRSRTRRRWRWAYSFGILFCYHHVWPMCFGLAFRSLEIH